MGAGTSLMGPRGIVGILGVVALTVLMPHTAAALTLGNCTAVANGTASLQEVPASTSTGTPSYSMSSTVANHTCSASGSDSVATPDGLGSATSSSSAWDSASLSAGVTNTLTERGLLAYNIPINGTTTAGAPYVNGQITANSNVVEQFTLSPGESANYTFSENNGGSLSGSLAHVPVMNASITLGSTTVVSLASAVIFSANISGGTTYTAPNGTITNTTAVAQTYSLNITHGLVGIGGGMGNHDAASGQYYYTAIFTITSANAVPTPSISSWSPTSGPPGTVISFNGAGLSGLRYAWVGAGHDAQLQNDTANSVQVVVPADASTGQIALGNGTYWVFTGGPFTVTGAVSGPPTVTQFNPGSGPVGTTLVLTGTNLNSVDQVWIGNAHSPSYKIISATTLQLTVPASAIPSGSSLPYAAQVALHNPAGWRFFPGFTITPLTSVSYTTPGSFTWTVPAGVTSINVVVSGGSGAGTVFGRGGAGGTVSVNAYPVTAGQTIPLVVGGRGDFNTSNNGAGQYSSVNHGAANQIIAGGGGAPGGETNGNLAGGTGGNGLGGAGQPGQLPSGFALAAATGGAGGAGGVNGAAGKPGGGGGTGCTTGGIYWCGGAGGTGWGNGGRGGNGDVDPATGMYGSSAGGGGGGGSIGPAGSSYSIGVPGGLESPGVNGSIVISY